MNDVVFWGTGYKAKELLDLYVESRLYSDDRLVLFCDSNPEKQGALFFGYPVVSPDELMNQRFDTLVIANMYISDIRRVIEERSICPMKKVLSIEEYRAVIHAKKQYYRRYGRVHSFNDSSFCEKKTKVFTAIIGDYDNLYDPLFNSPNIEYICFTDQKGLKSDIWNIRLVNECGFTNTELARRIKLLTWEYSPIECEYYIWVDAKYQIVSDLRRLVSEYRLDSGILMFPHPDNICICNELALLLIEGKGVKTDMIHQVSSYLSKGFPLDYGLYETACFVRKPKDLLVNRIMLQWWEELESKSYRDQLSLPYVFWANSFAPDICDLNIRNNEWLKLKGHKENKSLDACLNTEII